MGHRAELFIKHTTSRVGMRINVWDQNASDVWDEIGAITWVVVSDETWVEERFAAWRYSFTLQQTL